MRPYLKVTAIATALLASTVGGAFAAHSDHHHQSNIGTSVLRSDKSDDDTTFGYTNTMALKTPALVNVSMPRLQRIMHELDEVTARLDADRADKLLTAAQFRRLGAQEASIRSETLRLSHRYDGRLPTLAYTSLQNRIDHLGTAIARAA